MNSSLEMLEVIAGGLQDLLDEVVFVGGATVALYATDPAAPEARPTDDVDFFFLRPLSGAHEETARAQQAFQLQSRMIASFVISMLLLMLLLLSVPCINETEHCAIAMHIARGEQTSFVISMLFPET
jgi:hypothetical protein